MNLNFNLLLIFFLVLKPLKKATGAAGAEGLGEKLAGDCCPPLIENHARAKI